MAEVLLVVTLVAAAATGIGFLLEFGGALAAGFTIGESATLATGAVMTGVGTTAVAGTARAVEQETEDGATVATDAATVEAESGPPQTFGPFSHHINKGGLREILDSGQLRPTLGRYGDTAVRATMAPAGKSAYDGFFGEGTNVIFRTYVPPTNINVPQEWANWERDEGDMLDIIVDEIHLFLTLVDRARDGAIPAPSRDPRRANMCHAPAEMFSCCDFPVQSRRF